MVIGNYSTVILPPEKPKTRWQRVWRWICTHKTEMVLILTLGALPHVVVSCSDNSGTQPIVIVKRTNAPEG